MTVPSYHIKGFERIEDLPRDAWDRIILVTPQPTADQSRVTPAPELCRLDLIDEYKFLVHPRIAGHSPTLYQSGLPSARRLELVSAKPLRCGAVAMHYRRAR